MRTIEGVHRHIDEKGDWVVRKVDQKIGDAVDDIEDRIDDAEENINEHTSAEHEKTRRKLNILGLFSK